MPTIMLMTIPALLGMFAKQKNKKSLKCYTVSSSFLKNKKQNKQKNKKTKNSFSVLASISEKHSKREGALRVHVYYDVKRVRIHI